MVVLRCSVDIKKTDTDPSIPVWSVSLSSIDGEDGEWSETFGSIIELRAFIRGLKAAATMIGTVASVQEDYTANAGEELHRHGS